MNRNEAEYAVKNDVYDAGRTHLDANMKHRARTYFEPGQGQYNQLQGRSQPTEWPITRFGIEDKTVMNEAGQPENLKLFLLKQLHSV